MLTHIIVVLTYSVIVLTNIVIVLTNSIEVLTNSIVLVFLGLRRAPPLGRVGEHLPRWPPGTIVL